jgi:hypothetical protein
LYRFYWESNSRDKDLLKAQYPVSTLHGNEKSNLKIYERGYKDKNIRATSEYTVSFWMFINNYNSSSDYQSLFALMDHDATEYLLAAYLHPRKPQMVVRAGKIMGQALKDPLVLTAGSKTPVNDDSTTPCDVSDIDLQRWVHVAISVNGQILDVYVDGKLARSCILPSIQSITPDGSQNITLFHTDSTYNGYVSGVHFSSYAATPEQIYSNYRAGPYSAVGFLDYLWNKVGISVKYSS